jgi:chromosome segregation protein
VRLVSLSLSGYRQFFEPVALEIPAGLTGLCGDNGVGKSKLIEAIGYALYGPSRRVLPRGDKQSDLAARGVSSGTPPVTPRVELVIELAGQQYEVVRTPQDAVLRVKGAADPLAETSSVVTRKVIQLLRLTPLAYNGTFVARQKEVAGLQTLGRPARQRLVNRLIGITLVEHALALAQETRAGRALQRDAEDQAPGLTTMDATATLAGRRDEHRAATEAEAEALAALEEAKGVRQRALDAEAALKERNAIVAALQRELAGVGVTQTVLDKAHGQALRRVEDCTEAALELDGAERTLVETEGALAALEWQAAVAAAAALRGRGQTLAEDLAARIRPLVAERAALQAALQEDEWALNALSGELAGHAGARGRVEEAERQARLDAERHERRGRTAAELGPEDACDTCGQAFGDNLPRALDHYAGEARAAQERERGAHETAVVARMKEQDVQAQIDTRQRERDARVARLREQAYEDSPGEETRALADLQQAEDELAGLPADLRDASYDAGAHARAAARVARRERAEADVQRLRPLAALGAEARAEAEAAGRELARLDEQTARLKRRIAAETPALEAGRDVQERLAASRASLDDAETTAREAARVAATAAARVEAAEADAVAADRRERRIAVAKRALLVAERTEALLVRLLAEITEEARPRLAELMDGWARGLLGPRFQRVDLTPDYRILADNGSGLHQIEHFSGGEQTLLAVMLRVAISHFCRERAGFEAGFLVLDEVFGDQDGDHRAQLLQFLGDVKDQYHQVLIVNHAQDVTDMLDTIIDVERTSPTTSTARLRV